ncbi:MULTISPECIES: DUF1541 domain-containing protein [Bacillus]|uniref:DUF1541 domain-containing protein n=1 Tax=Bacillus TaxID=1386 RepID=UPI00158441F2|nr:YdhK family protein [Bacillus glycinifermentans]MBU8785142.1 DUF1541 domain-containing protein [Bacillus glycinifermentans]NUJ15311.1 DUF1541 domain-containing protein [Bacillus glycinifermentans]
MRKKRFVPSLFAVLLIVLGACGNTNTDKDHATKGNNEDTHEMDHSNMEVPEGLKEAKNPTYKVGTKAIMNANHMKGMNGAEATITGAYDTVVYAVSYTPTTGGKRVENHKWVVQEDIKDAGDKPFKPGAKVTLEAGHMKEMKGATATIDSAEKTTVYMVDYKPTTGGKEVKNHMWLTESELSPAD